MLHFQIDMTKFRFFISLLTICLSFSTLSAMASSSGGSGGGRPFFNEMSFDGGAVNISNVGVAPAFGGTFTSGLDFGTFGFEGLFSVLYGPKFSNFSSNNPFLAFDFGGNILIYTGKIAWKLGCAFIILGYPPSAGAASIYGDGVSPMFGFRYQSSRDNPVYGGFGVNAQAYFLQMSPTSSLGSTFGYSVTANLYFGFRLTFLEHFISQRRRW